ncbi:MAG TPA: ester cyclase [Verrucomicrobiales bacterium]|nr:ester cyclase [Verrucomicrobiales bacterium]
MPVEQISRLLDEMYAAWSLHDPERVDAIFTDDAVHEDVASGHISRGKAGIKQLLRGAFAFAPDFRSTRQSLAIAGDVATTEWVIEGTQTGPAATPWGEMAPSGRNFHLRGASIIIFREGRIARVTDYYDMATFLKQLGGSFQPAQAATP